MTRWRILIGTLAALVAGGVAGAIGAVLVEPWDEGADQGSPPPARAASAAPEHRRERSPFALRSAPGPPPVRVKFERPPRAGVLFDVRTGEVLWERHPRRELPIASLTKMMTALVIAERHRSNERVRITPETLAYEGSGVGVLPEGRKVKLEPMLNGLLLVSGNDAAIALAQHDAGSVPRFVRRMNKRARRLGLRCTRFSSPHGLQDRRNHSCPLDLAALARADLANRRISRIARTDHARFPFPIRGGYLDLYNNNPFIRLGAEGITGLKTGYTDAAGRCYVTTARRGGRHLGVVLLHSPNPIEQVPALLRAGARRG
ncbi:MAG TPA: serine hydrolase [Solirubrobacterales bacterium]|nr:serine hydrolase [Solirubrobacterales bacterium]